MSLLPTLQDPLTDCSLLGVCAVAERVGPHSGLMFLAIGFVVAGLVGLWRERKRRDRREPI